MERPLLIENDSPADMQRWEGELPHFMDSFFSSPLNGLYRSTAQRNAQIAKPYSFIALFSQTLPPPLHNKNKTRNPNIPRISHKNGSLKESLPLWKMKAGECFSAKPKVNVGNLFSIGLYYLSIIMFTFKNYSFLP